MCRGYICTYQHIDRLYHIEEDFIFLVFDALRAPGHRRREGGGRLGGDFQAIRLLGDKPGKETNSESVMRQKITCEYKFVIINMIAESRYQFQMLISKTDLCLGCHGNDIFTSYLSLFVR